MKPIVMIVDDEPLVLAALERLFRSQYEVHSFADPNAAIEDLKKQIHSGSSGPAVFISDYKLPEMTGIELLSHCRTITPSTVRVIISGHANIASLVDQVENTLAHRVVIKPWDNDVLLLQMKECLQLHQNLLEKAELEKNQNHDSLTGLLNRSGLDATFKMEVERALRHGRELTTLMVDLDHFKEINDQKGHLVGDEVLSRVSQIFLSATRNIDLLFRYGGDEFLFLLPDTSPEQGLEVANRICRKVSEALSEPVSVSIGIASCPRHGRTPQDLIQKADAALYVAKGRGRNQCVIAS